MIAGVLLVLGDRRGAGSCGSGCGRSTGWARRRAIIAGGDLSPPRQPGHAADRGRAARARAQRDARPARGRVRQAPGVRGPAAPLPVGRLARAAHAARLDPRLRRAVPDGRGARAGGGRAGDAADRGRGGPDGRAGRGPARARAARRAARAGAPPGRRRRASRATRSTTRARPRPTGRSSCDAAHGADGARRSAPAAPGARQPAAQRDRPHARRHAGRGRRSRATATTSGSTCATTGPGLPTADADALFDRFWRAEGGRERGKAGAGLGLAIVAGIVEAHHGRVHAEDAPGGGARFTVLLPAAAFHPPGAGTIPRCIRVP